MRMNDEPITSPIHLSVFTCIKRLMTMCIKVQKVNIVTAAKINYVQLYRDKKNWCDFTVRLGDELMSS